MILASWPFAAFVLVVLGAYFLLPRRGQLWLLLAASYLFYGTFSWQFPLGLLALTLANHWCARRLWSGAAKRWLWLGIGANLLVLAVLKYTGFFLQDVLLVLGLAPEEATGKVVRLVLPLGLSYRVLENISFLVDASRKQLQEFPGRLEHALYVAWFPKLVSGPIERGKAFLGQLSRPAIIDNETIARAMSLILIGLLRKIVLADTIRGLLPPDLWVKPPEDAGPVLLFLLLASVFVVYNDFAGYTDMVRGVSALFGIELSRNFAAPFFARNFSELWLRWHMSLSLWLRDYVYLPVSRALLRRTSGPNSPLNLIVPPIAAMMVSAVWHDAAWHMLAWGLLWGVFLILGRLPTLWRPIVAPDRQPGWRQALGMVGVAGMLTASNLLFQMDLAAAGRFLGLLFSPGSWTTAQTSVLLLILVSLGIDGFQHRSGNETAFVRWPLVVRSLALAIVILALFLATRARTPEPFIYQFF